MATWVAPIDSQTDPDAPLTSELGKRWDNNVIAVAEGASGAPRVSPKAWGQTVSADSAVGVVTVAGLGSYGGVVIDVKYLNSVAAGANMTIELSDDGVSFETAAIVAGVGGQTSGAVKMMIDFATGDTLSVYSDGDSAGHISVTAATPTGDVSHVRVTAAGGSTTTMGVMAMANAGVVA